MSIIGLGTKNITRPPVVAATEGDRIYIDWGDMRLVLKVAEAERLRDVLQAGIDDALEVGK